METQEYRYWDADGELRWVRDARVLVPSTAAAGDHVAGSWLDITTEMEAASDLARMNADLEGHVSDRTAMLMAEISEHRRTQRALTRVLESARCLLWEAEVEERDGALEWRVDRVASDRSVPLDLELEEDHPWYIASYRARLPEDDERMTQTARRALLDGEPGYQQDFRCVDRDGEIRWLHEDAYVEATGETSWRVIGVTTDITERKRGESLQAALYEINEAAHLAPDLPTMYASIHQSLGRLIDARNFYIALVDRDDPDTYAIPYCVDERHEIVPPRRSSLGKSRTAHVVRTGQPLMLTRARTEELVEAGELEFAGDPAEAWLGVPLITDEGVIGVAVVLSYEDEGRYTERDTELLSFVAGQIAYAIGRRRVQEELAYERGLFQTLMDNIPDYVYFKDTESRFLRVNREGARRLGVADPAEAIGKSDADFFPVEWEGYIAEDEREILRSGTPIIGAVERPSRPDGTRPWILVTKVPVYDADGEISGIVGINRDATEFVEAREALAESEGQRRMLLQRVLTAQEEERARIALELHDQVGQELSGILLGLKVAGAATSLDGAREQMSALRAQTSEAIESVRQMAFDMRPGSLQDLGLTVALRSELTTLGAQAGLRIQFDAPSRDELSLSPDAEVGLYRIIRAAVANIVDHARAGDARVVIIESAEGVSVAVRDDGVGFDVDGLMTAPVEGRFGILAMQERAEMLAGTMCVESAPGEGTTVHVTIPKAATGETRSAEDR
jgi:PAS domain S-box-containing protein